MLSYSLCDWPCRSCEYHPRGEYVLTWLCDWPRRRLEPARQQKARAWWVMTYLCSLCQSTVNEFRGTCWFKLAPETITPVTIWFSPYDSRQCALGLLKLALEKAVEWDLPLRPLACTSTVVASCSGRSLVRRTLYLRKHRPIAHMTFPSHSRFAQSVCCFLQALKKHTLKH